MQKIFTLGFFVTILAVTTPILAANVGSEATQGNDTKTGQKIEDSKSINIKQGKTKKDSAGAEKRATQESRAEAKQSDDITMETSAANLFIPILQEIENSMDHPAANSAVSGMLRNCSFLSANPPVPTTMALEMMTHMIGRKQFEQVLNGTYRGMHTETTSGEIFSPNGESKFVGPTKRKITDNYLTEDFNVYHKNRYVQSAPARDVVQCYFAYGITMERAIKQMAAGRRTQESALGEKTVVVHGDLDTEANKAITSALSDPTLEADIVRHADNTISGGCMVPTMVGIQQGSLDWTCGSLKVDPTTLSATYGAMPVIGDNVFMGVKLNFAQASGQSSVASNAKSKSKYSSSESAKESGQELTQGKSRTTSQESGTSTGRSRKSDTSASPK